MIEKVLRVNAVHLQEETFEMLCEEATMEEAQCPSNKTFKSLKVFNKNREGFFIEIDKEKYQDDIPRLPTELAIIINYAKLNDCYLVCIADNEEVVDWLEKYC